MAMPKEAQAKALEPFSLALGLLCTNFAYPLIDS